MSRREKKLMVATMLVVLLGASTWMLKTDAPARAESDRPATTSTTSTSTSSTSSSSTPSAAPPAAGGETPVAFVSVDRDQLRSLLEWKSQRIAPTSAGDPFGTEPTPRPSMAPASPGETAPPPEREVTLPVVGGVFLSGATRGALLDDHVCFVGQTHGDFTLVEVQANAVKLHRDDREYTVPYGTGSENSDSPPPEKKQESP